MKKIILSLSILSLILMFSCNSGTKPEHVKKKTNDENDSILVTKTYHSSGGLWKVNRGKKVIVNGKTKFVMHGEVLEYYKTPEGALSSKAIYKDGKRDGQFAKYYTDGKVYYKVNYSQGKMDGVKTSYHKDGKVMAEIPYKRGLIGVGTKEYTPDGKLLAPMELKVWYKKSGNSVTIYAQALNKGKVTRRAEFFEGLLVEGKYAHKGLQKIPMKDGKARITIPNAPDFVSVSVKVKSARNNYSLLNKSININ